MLTGLAAAAPGQEVGLRVSQRAQHERPGHVGRRAQRHAQRRADWRPQHGESGPQAHSSSDFPYHTGQCEGACLQVNILVPPTETSTTGTPFHSIILHDLLTRRPKSCCSQPARGPWHLTCSRPSRLRTSGASCAPGTRPASSAAPRPATALAAERPLATLHAWPSSRASTGNMSLGTPTAAVDPKATPPEAGTLAARAPSPRCSCSGGTPPRLLHRRPLLPLLWSGRREARGAPAAGPLWRRVAGRRTGCAAPRCGAPASAPQAQAPAPAGPPANRHVGQPNKLCRQEPHRELVPAMHTCSAAVSLT